MRPPAFFLGMSVKDPASRARPSPDKALSAAPAVHDARLDPRVVLPGPGKVRVHVLDLDQSDGNMLRELIIGPASQSHRKGISGATAAAPEVLAAEEHLSERGQ